MTTITQEYFSPERKKGLTNANPPTRFGYMNNTHNTQALLDNTFAAVNSHVYTSLMDMGVDPGRAYDIAFIEVPMSDSLEAHLITSNINDDYDDLI